MRLSTLLRREALTESGESLGHVFDVRVARRPGGSPERADQQWRVVGLLVGTRGMRERFGFTPGGHAAPTLDHDLLPWEAVLRLEDGKVIVRDGTRPE